VCKLKLLRFIEKTRPSFKAMRVKLVLIRVIIKGKNSYRESSFPFRIVRSAFVPVYFDKKDP